MKRPTLSVILALFWFNLQDMHRHRHSHKLLNTLSWGIGLLLFMLAWAWMGASNRNNSVAGNWRVASSAAGADSGKFVGSLSITPLDESFALLWNTPAGDNKGIGIQMDTLLAAAWGLDDKSYAVAIYSPQPNGNWTGLTTHNQAEGTTGTERIAGMDLDRASGTYELSGTEAGPFGLTYQGQLILNRQGDYYEARYWTGDSVRKAIGFRAGTRLVVVSSEGEKFGAALYTFNRNYSRAQGVWALYGSSRVNVEYLRR